MMRVIFLLLVSSIALQSKSQTWNNYLQKRFKSYGIWADSILLVPNDTSLNKTGFAIKGSTAYIGDGVKWTAITGGSSSVDSLVYATWLRLYKVRDSLLAANNTWLGVNKFNRQIEVDSLKGAGTLYITGNLENSADIKAGRRLQAGKSLVGNGIFRFYNYNHNYRTDLQGDSMLTSNVDLLLPSSSGKLALTTDIAPVDTSIISTKAYVDYKDDIQQGFIDMRKLDADSIAWTGYATRARLQQQLDSAGAAQAVINGVQNDTLTSHNTRILANQNATNTNAANINLKVNIADTASMLAGYKVASILTSGTLDDARLSSNVALLNTAQTITADKTTTALFTANANNLGTTQDETKGVTLSNESASTVGTPNQISPALILKGSVWNTGPSLYGIAAGANTTKWKIENTSLSGNTALNMDNYLDISMAWGSNGYTRIGRFTKAGLETNLFQNTLTLGQPGNAGILVLNRSSGGSIGSITGQSAGISISSAQIFFMTSGYVQLASGLSQGSRFSMTTGLLIQPDANAAANSASRLSVIGNASIGANVAAPTNGLIVSGRSRLTGLETEIITRTADYTVTETDNTILVDATSGNVTITLRTAVGSKQDYLIKRIDNSGNTVTVATTSSQTIDGSTTYTGLTTQWSTVKVKANGVNYFITAKF